MLHRRSLVSITDRPDMTSAVYHGSKKSNKQSYALVICNYGPQSRGRAGDSRGNVRCFYFCIVPAVRGKYPGFVLYRQKRQCNENITDCGGKLLWFYQLTVLSRQCGGYSRGWKNEKSKSPLFPGGGGPWLQMTSALVAVPFTPLGTFVF